MLAYRGPGEAAFRKIGSFGNPIRVSGTGSTDYQNYTRLVDNERYFRLQNQWLTSCGCCCYPTPFSGGLNSRPEVHGHDFTYLLNSLLPSKPHAQAS